MSTLLRTARSIRQFSLRVAAFGVASLWALGSVSCSSGVTDTSRVASVELEPEAVVVAVGAVAPLTAIVQDANGNNVSSIIAWSSSDTAVARVSSAGVVTARTIGEATIAATTQGISATAMVTVSARSVASVRISPTSASVRVGATTRLGAEALDAGGEVLPERSMAWTSSNTNIASVDASGVVTGRFPGAATITATSEGRSGSASVTVTLVPVATVTLSPSLDTVQQGANRQLTATARDEGGTALSGRVITWNSTQPQVAGVSSSGLVTAATPGKTSITASSEGITGTAEIVVRARPVETVVVLPASSSIEVGTTVPLNATLRDSEGNVLTGRAVSWSSNNNSIATVNSSGVVSAIAPGNASIVATSEGRTGTASVIVTQVPVATVTVTPPTATVLTGKTITLVATARSSSGAVLSGRAVNWTSGASGIATVSNTGVVTGVAPGTALIFAEVEGVTNSATITVQVPAVATVTVTPASPTIAVAGTRQMIATARDSENNVLQGRAVSWSSSDEGTVFVTSSGVVIGFRKGTATITATVEGVTGSTLVTVN